MTTYFAAYDADAIHGVGTTPTEALADAAANGAECTRTAEITADLFAEIQRDGWDGWSRSFRIEAGLVHVIA